MEKNVKEKQNDWVDAFQKIKEQKDRAEAQQEIIRQMEKDHEIEMNMLKVRIYDLQEELEIAKGIIREYKRETEENKRSWQIWKEQHTDPSGAQSLKQEIIIDADAAAKKLNMQQFWQLLEILESI